MTARPYKYGNMISPPPAPTNRLLILADGENLVFRCQALIGAGKKLDQAAIIIPDIFAWHTGIPSRLTGGTSIVRVIYYTSAVGTDDAIAKYEREISKTSIYRAMQAEIQIHPRVFKKEAKSKKTKIVDMSICIDALRHSYHRDVDTIFLLSGDGDYLPLVKEIMRTGTQVWIGAFSDGLNPKIPSAVDRFIDLDTIFFLRA